jgi:cytochrome c-type biogenesis protein CcmE
MHPNNKAQKRLLMIIAIFSIVTSGIIMSLYFASDNIVFFLKPSELKAEHLGKKIRIGGLISNGSIQKMHNRVVVFNVTDNIKTITILYRGMLPALFRDGQGIVAEGVIMDLNEQFIADRLLTKHDENYKPPDLK